MNITIDSNIQKIIYNSAEINKLVYNGHVVWEAGPIDYSTKYFTIVSSSDDNFIAFRYTSNYKPILYVSIDGGNTWEEKNPGSNAYVYLGVLNSGEKMLIKGNNNYYATSISDYCYFTSNYMDIEGNIMSLIYGDNFIGQTTLPASYTFAHMFASALIHNAENLIMPATACTPYCYYSMFRNIGGLYTTPELPATTLADSCYYRMFYGCFNITTAPVLPATTLVTNCYYQMFRNCEFLEYIDAYFTTTPSDSYTYQWVAGVSPTGTFEMHEGMRWNVTGDNGIPTGWTVIKPAHDYSLDYLTIRSLVNNNTIQYLRSGTGTGIDRQIYYSTNGGTSWTSAYKSMMTVTLNEGDTLLLKGSNSNYADGSKYLYFSSTGNVDIEGNIMSMVYGDNFAGQTTLTANYAFQGMFRTCKVVDASNLILPATTLSNYCYANMFQSVSTLTAAPTLPAAVLTDYCYFSMFLYCSSLKYIKCLATNISAYWCTRDWTYGVASGGTFVKAASMTSWTTGYGHGIPSSSWTVQDA